MKISSQRSTKSIQKVRVRPEACIKCRESKLKCDMNSVTGSCARCTLQRIPCSGPQPTPQRVAKRAQKAKFQRVGTAPPSNIAHSRDISPTSSNFTVPPSPSDTQDSVCSDFSEMLASQQRHSDLMEYLSPSVASGSGSSMALQASSYATDYMQAAAVQSVLPETRCYDFVNTNLVDPLDANLLTSSSPSLIRRRSFPEDHEHQYSSTIWTSSDNFMHWEPVLYTNTPATTAVNTCQPSDLELAQTLNTEAAVQSYTTSNDFLFSNFVQF